MKNHVVRLKLPSKDFRNKAALDVAWEMMFNAQRRATEKNKPMSRNFRKKRPEIVAAFNEARGIFNKSKKARIILLVTGGVKDEHEQDVYRRQAAKAFCEILATNYRPEYSVHGVWTYLSKKLDVYAEKKFGIPQNKALFLTRIRLSEAAKDELVTGSKPKKPKSLPRGTEQDEWGDDHRC